MNTNPEKKPKRKLNLSPEERERRRETARRVFSKIQADRRAELQQVSQELEEYSRTHCDSCRRPYDLEESREAL